MSLKKQILFCALIFSFHGAIISMETEIDDQAKLINIFARDIIPQAKDIKPMSDWLMQKRNEIPDDTSWNNFVDKLLEKVVPTDDLLSTETIPVIKNVIEEIALNLQPDHDCSQMLADHATKAAREAISKFIKANDFTIENSLI